MIEVVVAEMKRSLRRNLGTNFAGVTANNGTELNIFSFLNNLTTLDGAGQAILLSQRINLVGSIANGSDSLDIFMEAIQEKGLAKILAEPTLVARSGEPARFLAGGEIPIPVPQSGLSDRITIEFKEFGVGVVFTPTVMGPDRIHLHIATEVSEPEPTLGVQLQGFLVPAFMTRRAATGVELGDGESFAIAGLLRDDLKEIVHEFPGLGDIPVLGALFRSTEFRKDETELVMVITPRLVKPLPPGSPVLPTDHFIEPNAAEFFLLGSLEGGVIGRLFSDPPAHAALGGPGKKQTFNDGVAGDVGHRVDLTHAEEGW
jgi:pilus assembly protein CpaC